MHKTNRSGETDNTVCHFLSLCKTIRPILSQSIQLFIFHSDYLSASLSLRISNFSYLSLRIFTCICISDYPNLYLSLRLAFHFSASQTIELSIFLSLSIHLCLSFFQTIHTLSSILKLPHTIQLSFCLCNDQSPCSSILSICFHVSLFVSTILRYNHTHIG